MKRHCVVRSVSTSRISHRRAGAILVVFVVLLLLASMTVGVLLQVTMQQRGAVKSASLQTQAEWILQSAANRAAVKLRQDANWNGETWKLTAEELQQTNDASAVIDISKDANKPSRRQAQITVLYPAEDAQRVRLQREYVIDLP